MNRIILGLIIILTLMVSQSWAANWVSFHKDETFTYSIDLDSIVVNHNASTVTFWIEAKCINSNYLEAPDSDRYDWPLIFRTYTEFNYQSRMYNTYETAKYNKRGDYLGSDNIKGWWAPIRPDSLQEKAFNFLMNRIGGR
jgi:hypothetical protein